MSAYDARYKVSILVCASAAALAMWLSRPLPVGNSAAITLPDKIGGWQKMEDIHYDGRVLKILGTRDVASSVYRKDARTLTAIVVRAANNRSAFHPPEYCLTGSGAEIIEKRSRGLGQPAPFTVNEMLVIEKGQ